VIHSRDHKGESVVHKIYHQKPASISPVDDRAGESKLLELLSKVAMEFYFMEFSTD